MSSVRLPLAPPPRPAAVSATALALLAWSAASCSPTSESTPPPQSFWIADVEIVDGTGGPAYHGAVEVRGETVGARIVDGAGLTLAPGFVDTHSHHDRGLSELPDAPAAVAQGITTIVVGQDGASPLPLGDFFSSLERSPVAVNVAAYSGHNSIRREVMGLEARRPAGAGDLDRMKELLQADLDAGALGLSTGLEYDPGIFSTGSEVLELAHVAAAAGGRYISHLRSEDRRLEEAVDELLEIGRQARLPVQISHFKLAMQSLWGRAPELLDRLDRARAEGVDVTADVYPYDYWQSTMTVLFPERVFDRNAARFALEELAPPEGIRITVYRPQPELVGRTLAEIAADKRQDPVVTYLDLIARAKAFESADQGPVEMILGTSMHAADIDAILAWPHANICSDGALVDRHPRGSSTYPRILGHYVRERGVLRLEEAVHKATRLAAHHVGLDDLGVIAEGAPADLVLFDPATVADRATAEDPARPPAGIAKVWVNGTLVHDGGKSTGARPGRVLRRTATRSARGD